MIDTFYLPGELVPAGRPVLSLLSPEQIKIIFFIPQSYLSQLKLAQLVTVTCDNCVSPIKAKIDFIAPQAEYTPPVIYSDALRSKLVYRIEAAPNLNEAIKLHPGQPVNVLIQ